MLESLTPEQEALCDAIAEEYIADLTKPTPPDLGAIERWMDVVYRLYDKPRPQRIEIAASPRAALKLASELTDASEAHLDDCGIGDGGWVSFYDFFHRIGILSDDEARDVLALRDYMRCAWDTVLLDECAIVVRRPTALKVDDSGNLHCANGPCIEWQDGEKDYAWHGTWVTEKVILSPRSHTREEFLAISNTELRRALSEAAGWGWVADLLGATEVDTWTDPVTSLEYKLLRCTDGAMLLSKQSPKLKDGSQPTYLEPVHEDLKTARAARKWQATSLTADECERDPHLVYGTEA